MKNRYIVLRILSRKRFVPARGLLGITDKGLRLHLWKWIWRAENGTERSHIRQNGSKLRDALVHQVRDWYSGVAIKMGRRQGTTREHIWIDTWPRSNAAAGPFSSQFVIERVKRATEDKWDSTEDVPPCNISAGQQWGPPN